jgi:UDP-GlcNAc:undecaprenyl-phosphate GlcNAc-1-phosphate transferase
MYPQMLLAAGAALLVSLAMTRMMMGLAPRLGLIDRPGDRRIHTSEVPRAGGIAIWLAFLIVIGGGLLSGFLTADRTVSPRWLEAFAAGSLVLMVAGFADDRGGLRPWVKLGAHALAPSVFFLIHPISTGLFPHDWHGSFEFLAFVVWSVVLINAFNLIDGLDGLCGGLSIVACVALAVLAMVNGRMDSAILLLVMAGAIAGFLRYNFNPARIFLGDAGSMLMGFFLAAAATQSVGRRAVVGAILLPIAVAGVPLLDVLLAIWRRGAKRVVKKLNGEKIVSGLFDADADHLHHRLLASKGSQRKVATLLHGIAILIALLAFMPMIFGEQLLGFSVVGFMIIGMVGLRNLARVEIQHTGNVIHMAIKVPSRRRKLAALLFLYDFVVLFAAGTMAVLIETNGLTRGAEFMGLSRFIVLFTVLGCISTLVVRVHHRLWVRATMRDILALQFWLLVTAIATFTLFSTAYSDVEWSALRLSAMSFVLACTGVCLPRVALDLMRDFDLDARSRCTADKGGVARYPVVILGAGDLGTLLLDHLKSSAHDQYPGLRVLGFLDEVRFLHGRRLRSFRVLGGLSSIASLAENEGLKGVILAIKNPREELLRELDELAARYDLGIHRWDVEISGLPAMERISNAPLPRSGAAMSGRREAILAASASEAVPSA